MIIYQVEINGNTIQLDYARLRFYIVRENSKYLINI